MLTGVFRGACLCSHSPMFPQPYVPTALCSHSPMFPQPNVPTFLRAFSKLGLMFPQLCVPTFLKFITKLGPMFLQFPHFYPCLVVKGSPFRSWRFEGAS